MDQKFLSKDQKICRQKIFHHVREKLINIGWMSSKEREFWPSNIETQMEFSSSNRELTKKGQDVDSEEWEFNSRYSTRFHNVDNADRSKIDGISLWIHGPNGSKICNYPIIVEWEKKGFLKQQRRIVNVSYVEALDPVIVVPQSVDVQEERINSLALRAMEGNSHCKLRIGSFSVLSQVKVDSDRLELGLRFLNELNNVGNERAKFLLGMYYYYSCEGSFETNDCKPELGIDLIKQTADSGNVEAMFQVGFIYLTGKVFEKDLAVSFLYFKKAAIEGCEKSQAFLGDMYRNGYFVTKSLDQSLFYLKEAAKEAHGVALQNLAYMHIGKREQKYWTDRSQRVSKQL